MLDQDRPLPLDQVVERGLAIFNATLPQALGLAVIGALGVNLTVHFALGADTAEVVRLLAAGRFGELLERFGTLLLAIGVLSFAVNTTVLHLVGTLARGQRGDGLASLAAVLRLLPPLLLACLGYLVALWLGLALLVLPGLFVGVALSFFVQAALFDGQRGLAALGASWRLTRGHWWRSFALYLAIGAALLLAMLIASLIAGAVVAALGALGVGAAPLAELVVGSLCGAVVNLGVEAVLVAYYYDLTVRAGTRRGPPAPSTIAA